MDLNGKPGIRNGAVDWAQVLTDNCRWLHSVLYARLNDRQATEDVYQEICWSVLDNKPSIPIDKPAAWLYRVAVRHASSYIRSESRLRLRNRTYAETKENARDEKSDWTNPQSWIFAQEQSDLIAAALTQLKTSERQVLFLKYNEGWKCRKIGEVMGVSESTVQTRLLRARQKLRQLLSAHFGEDKNE